MVARRKENLSTYNSMGPIVVPNIGESSLIQPKWYLPRKSLCKVSSWRNTQELHCWVRDNSSFSLALKN